jgi:RHS repeat-associated protein
MEADKSGSLTGMKRHDYLPFGEELSAGIRVNGQGQPQYGYAISNVRQKYDEYERDTETNLDFAEARYYSSTQGRFTSPDPLIASARRLTPQSWNRYSFVINRPTVYTDPGGEDWYSKDGTYYWFPGNGDREGYKKPAIGPDGLRIENVQGADGQYSKFNGHNVTLYNNDITPLIDNGVYLPVVTPLPPIPWNQDSGLRALAIYAQTAEYALGGPVKGVIDFLIDVGIDQLSGGEGLPDPATIQMAGTTVAGPFSINDWSGYPEGLPRPEGPFTLMGRGDPAYEAARQAANTANQRVRGQLGNEAAGMEIHEIHPVQLGGHPTATFNKAVISKAEHARYTRWWRNFVRAIRR